jgi:CubicO group peptidase (beta-lactamase class C family)
MGFGHADCPDSAPIAADTIFSVKSMSMLFTATEVMQAVAAGRLDLDEPITPYLPEFTVQSAYEEHPERTITLRMLLGHTAGFTHEAPVGNNNELDPGDFDAYVRSISGTWPRFPVGSGCAYGNLEIDLAGSILERVEGRSFHEVVGDSLLAPRGIERSTFDRDMIHAAADRAVEHPKPYAAAGRRADDCGRRPVRQRRRPRSLPPLPAQRRDAGRPGRARPAIDWGDANRPDAAGGCAGRLRARVLPSPLEPLDQRPGDAHRLGPRAADRSSGGG